jgi:hypothetical protein
MKGLPDHVLRKLCYASALKLVTPHSPAAFTD